jgi:hypothetical protein
MTLIRQERETLAQERDTLAQERDTLAQERDTLAQERDILAQERDRYKGQNTEFKSQAVVAQSALGFIQIKVEQTAERLELSTDVPVGQQTQIMMDLASLSLPLTKKLNLMKKQKKIATTAATAAMTAVAAAAAVAAADAKNIRLQLETQLDQVNVGHKEIEFQLQRANSELALLRGNDLNARNCYESIVQSLQELKETNMAAEERTNAACLGQLAIAGVPQDPRLRRTSKLI